MGARICADSAGVLSSGPGVMKNPDSNPFAVAWVSYLRGVFQIRAEESTENVRVLESLTRVQKIPYDFGFYKMEFEVDHRTISLSSGFSVVSTMASVPLLPSRDGNDPGSKAAGLDTARTTVLGRLRVYFEATRRMEVFLDKSASTRAEDDFVKARRQGKEVTVSKSNQCSHVVER